MKGMLIGLATGVVTGAILAKNCKPCSQMMDDMSQKFRSMGKKKGNQSQEQSSSSQESCECGSDCECGNDCDCGYDCHCSDSDTEQ